MLKREDLSKADFSAVATGESLPILHPGRHLQDYLEGAGISQYRLAKAIHVPPRRINEIVQGKRGISADTALRLARFFRTTPEFWMNLQSAYELACASEALGDRLQTEIEPVAA